ncbi:MAG: transposase [Janthinobacterium lividum]
MCQRKPTCAPKVKKRQLIRTAYAPYYRRALGRQQGRQGQRMRLLRQRTIEPVFGSLLQHYGLRRVNARGRSRAHKTRLLTAIAFNLKKFLKHHPKKTISLAISLPSPFLEGQFWACWLRRHRHQSPCEHRQ